MPPLSTTDEFLDLARQSGAVEPKVLDEYLQRQADTQPAAPPARLASALVADGLLTKFQAEMLLSGRMKRFVISGKYTLLDRLGAGGMATVYLCEHRVMRRRVAIKVLPVSLADDHAALERFHREARACAALNHPNIVGAHDVDRDGKMHFLVIEYIDGCDLHHLVKKEGPLDYRRAANYMAQTAAGLQHAHEAGLVHRDIKPSNLLLDKKGVIKILDMGLALFFQDKKDNLTQQFESNTTLGTADYLAPEQGIDSHTVDIRADIYSLGITFYYLLTGKHPLGEGSVSQILLWHHMKPAIPLRQFRPDVPEELAAVIHKMMAKNADDRYQEPKQLIEALAPWAGPGFAGGETRPGLSSGEFILARDTDRGVSSPSMVTPVELPLDLPIARLLDADEPVETAAGRNGVSAATQTAETGVTRRLTPPVGGKGGKPGRAKADPDSAVTKRSAAGKEKDRPAKKESPSARRKRLPAQTASHRWLVIGSVAVVALAVLIGGGAVAWRMSLGKPPETAQSGNPGSAMPLSPEPVPPKHGTTAAPSTSPGPQAVHSSAKPVPDPGMGKTGSTTPEAAKVPVATPPKPAPVVPVPEASVPVSNPGGEPKSFQKPTSDPPVVTPPQKPTDPPAPEPTLSLEYFYQAKPGESLYYDTVDYLKNNHAVRYRYDFKDKGVIDGVPVKTGKLNGSLIEGNMPEYKTVTGVGGHVYFQFRIKPDLIELALDVPRKEKIWEPIIKLGAKPGESWKLTLPNGDAKKYQFVRFDQLRNRPSAVVTVTHPPLPSGEELVETHIYVKALGEVERSLAVAKDGKSKVIFEMKMIDN